MPPERSSAHELRKRAASEAGSVLLETSNARHKDAKTYFFASPHKEIVAHTLSTVEEGLRQLEDALRQGQYAAGFLSYEAGFAFEPSLAKQLTPQNDLPLMWFGIYDTPEIHSAGITSPNLESSPSLSLHLELQKEEYARRVAAIRSLIESGDTYQANLTMNVRWKSKTDAAALFSHMMHMQPVEYGALINLGEVQILSASPELFFERYEGSIQTRPMKGTAPRGRTNKEDDEICNWLHHDEKNRSENLMIVDLLRNDLGRICVNGSVKVSNLFQVERYPTLFQMTTSIEGTLRSNTSYLDIFRALFPSGSIVGAPKIHTMEILRKLEARNRGIYTGAIGFIAPQQKATFSVAIRTAILRNEDAVMGVGSGIVYDSDADNEYEECITKTSFLTQPSQEFQLIETLLWNRDYTFLDQHMKRLSDSARYFDFACDIAAIVKELREYSHRFGCSDRQRVRLLLHRDGSISITNSDLPLAQDHDLRVLLSPLKTNSRDRFLFHKTTRRNFYDHSFAEAQKLHCADALFLNEEDQLTEGAIHNLVLVKDGVWLTPSQKCGLLAGIYRGELLARGKVREAVLNEQDLARADEVYLCNSVRGLRLVTQVVRHAASGLQRIWQSH